MSRRRGSRLIVVDACVVRAAGETEHPRSSACRNCLEEIRTICHRVAISPVLKDEWDRHMSRFSRKWRRSMAARQKPLQIIEPVENPLKKADYRESTQRAIDKDLPLLQTALAADSIIVSLDDSLKQELAEDPEGKTLLESIRWINPEKDDLQILYTL